MPIYMDIHNVPGIEAIDVAEAHQKDIAIQEEYHCKAMTYWVDENRGTAFCLISAPDKQMVEEMHRRAHGLVPNKVIEVNNEVVESFLGRIYDPEETETSDSGLKVFSDSAFRILLVTDTTDPVLLRHKLGSEKADELLNEQNNIIRKELSTHDGRKVENAGSGFIASFSSAVKAIACAVKIQKNLADTNRHLTGFKIGISAGNPVDKSDKLFGDTIQLARHLGAIAKSNQVALSSAVKELAASYNFQDDQKYLTTLSPQDEILLESIFNTLEKNWQDADFTGTEFCQAMAMSKSQLYRKTIVLSGLSPNILLKEFRLDKARELLKNKRFTISQATFDSGFTSPSYFTKCFKKKFGLLPEAYLHLLQ
ncbi:MAG TPA: nickel-binding protein [Chitinophagaceae bacterium]|nr:nickel-binding protein [Chitinophagaceae bacterium]